MRALVDLLFPQLCLQCGARAESALCGRCYEDFPRVGPDLCLRCGFPQGRPSDGCRECKRRDFNFDMARQAVPFDGGIRKAIHRIKYSSERSLVATLVDLLSEIASDFPAAPLTWVPAASRKVRERGFDHAELLVTSLGTALDRPVLGLLEKTRDVEPQMRLLRAERSRNIAGALRCKMPSPHDILIVDDVLTTGATLSEASRALRTGGAKYVGALCVARTLPPGGRHPYNR